MLTFDIPFRRLFAAAVSIFFCAAGLSKVALAQDGDMDMLRALERKGILTAQEASDIAKEYSKVPVVVSEKNRMFSISGCLQFQYAHLATDGRSGIASDDYICKSGFMPRRVIATFKADMENGWGAQASFDIILPHCMSSTFIYKKIDNAYLDGQMKAGYFKPNMCVEEYTAATKLTCISRSLATNYWTGTYGGANRKLGFGGFMTACCWYGKSRQINGLDYAFGLSNSQNYELDMFDMVDDGGDNCPDFWFSASQTFSFDFGTVKVGLNGGYGPEANKLNPMNASAMWAVNPYLQVKGKNWNLLAEFLSAGIEDGKKMADGKYNYAMPIGLNFIFEYLFETQFGKIGPVFRYAYLNTDGRGTTIGESLRRAPDASMTRVFRNAQAFYLGVNWYLRGDDLKVQFCYEFGQFSGAPSNAPENDLQVEDAQTFRVQIQMLF